MDINCSLSMHNESVISSIIEQKLRLLAASLQRTVARLFQTVLNEQIKALDV